MKTLVLSRGYRVSGFCLVLSLCFFCCNKFVVAVDFTEIARFDVFSTSQAVNTEFIGVNPVAIAYKGNKLYLGGYNNSASFANTSITQITNSNAIGLVTPTYSPVFGTDLSPGGRGYTGLALSSDGSQLAASLDQDSEGPFGSLQVFTTSDNGLLWSKTETINAVGDPINLRGGSGVDFDPGFPGGNAAQGAGVAWVRSFDSGRRALQNASTGADIWTPNIGFQWIPNGGNQGFTRDIAFDPSTGDMYIRSSNEVYFADRSGDNSTTVANNVKLVDNADAPFVNYQHIAFLNTSNDGNLLMFNNRSSGAAGQDFFTVNNLVNTSGVAQAMNFTWLPNADSSPFLPATGAGWYDYDFDATSQTLALLDISNRSVHIFQVGTANPSLPGDFDNDGEVDGRDFLVWQRGNSPNGINSGDLGLWQANYGTPLAPAIAAVPEPTTALLALVGLTCYLVRRRS